MLVSDALEKKLDAAQESMIATHAKLLAIERQRKELTDLIQQVEGIKHKLKILRDR